MGEANALITVLAAELGLVRARAQGVRRSGAKLAPALTTFAESTLVVVRGREGWRIAGAVLETPWFARFTTRETRDTAARVVGLVIRLAPGEGENTELFSILESFFTALATCSPEMYEAIEILAALRILAVLGFDAGGIPTGFSLKVLKKVMSERLVYIARVNRGIEASGL
ncbi:MAG: recombination protein O N-terminal domain-containing protein [Patescibacteria group bacterium]